MQPFESFKSLSNDKIYWSIKEFCEKEVDKFYKKNIHKSNFST